MQPTNNNAKWISLLLVQIIALAGLIYLSFSIQFGPLQIISIAFAFLFIQAFVFGKQQLNSFKENFMILVLAVIFNAAAIATGGFFETINRFFVGSLAMFLLFFLVYDNQKGFIQNLINIVFAMSPIAIIYTNAVANGTRIFYPIFLLPYLIVPVFLAIVYLVKPAFLRLIIGVVVCWLLAYVGYKNYLNKITGEKFSVEKASSKLFPLISSNEDTIRLATDMAGKIVLLDFWHSSCGVCFREFPKLQALADKYSTDPAVYIATVNVMLPKDTMNQYKAMISEYRFNKYRTMQNIDVNEWGIEAYPTTLVLDKQGRIRYKGLVNYESGINSIDDIIADLKKE